MTNSRSIALLTLALILGFIPSLFAAGPKENILYNFGVNGSGDAVYPAAGLVADADGNLYGTAVQGGTIGNGAVFKLSPPATAGGAWTETLLYSFGPTGADGAGPFSTLVFDSAGNIYGTTEGGGASGYGTVFELSPPATAGGDWTKTTLYSFQPTRFTGALPVGKLTLGPAGIIFGVTEYGGSGAKCEISLGCGVVYQLTPPATTGSPWAVTVLHSFGSTKQDGINPQAGVLYRGGNLFGTTWHGGVNTDGIAYVLVPNSSGYAERILHTFSGADGVEPTGSLVADAANNLYGTTDAGGTSANCTNTFGCGTIFQLSPPAVVGGAWSLHTLYSFTGGFDGANPLASLWRSQAGDLYGTANNGGFDSGTARDSGVFFRLIHPAIAGEPWKLGTIHAFAGSPTDGSDPQAEVIYKNHAFYGVTVFGGTNGTGAIFSVGP